MRRPVLFLAGVRSAGQRPGRRPVAVLHNGPEYLETYAAAFKAGLVPVNVNFRYGPAELSYLLDNADVEAVELAGYKVPRSVLIVPSIGRSPAGKMDYPELRRVAVAATGAGARARGD